MVVGLTTIYAISAYHPSHGEVYSIQRYVMNFVSDLGQVDGFLRVLQFPPPIKLHDRHDISEILLKVVLIKDKVLLMVGCAIFPPILIGKYLFTGSLKKLIN